MWPSAGMVAASCLLRRKTATTWRNGMRMICGTKPGQGAFCAIAGLDYEPELRWILSILNSGDVFVDVGANVGVYSVHAARKVGPSGRVVAIEPSAQAAAILTANASANDLGDIITVINAAASNTQGSLYLAGNAEQWNSLSLSASPTGPMIAVTTLDKTLASDASLAGRIKCIKIDAEGVETQVLQGAANVISQSSPYIVFENTFETTRCEAALWLKQHGYKILTLQSILTPTNTTNTSQQHGANLIAVPLNFSSAS